MFAYMTSLSLAVCLSVSSLNFASENQNPQVYTYHCQNTQAQVVAQANGPSDLVSLVRCLFGDLRDLNSVSLKSRPYGLEVNVSRNRVVAETLYLQTPGGPAGPVCHGLHESMVMRACGNGLVIDNISGVTVMARGPLGAYRQTYTKSSQIGIDSYGVPYFVNTSVYQGPLGRWRSATNVLTQANLPTNPILAALAADPNNLGKLVKMIESMKNVDSVTLVRQPGGTMKLTVNLKAGGDVDVNKKVGSHDLKSINFSKQLTADVEENGTTIKLTNIQDVKLTVSTLIGDLTLPVRSFTLETAADGSRQVKLDLESPLTGRTISITLPADKLSESFNIKP